jgi:hypothetical protein
MTGMTRDLDSFSYTQNMPFQVPQHSQSATSQDQFANIARLEADLWDAADNLRARLLHAHRRRILHARPRT